MPYKDSNIRKQKTKEASQRAYARKRAAMEAAGHVFRKPLSPDERAARRKAYAREWNRQDRIKNPEKQREVLRKSRQKNYEKRLAGNRRWCRDNPEAVEAMRLRSRYKLTATEYDKMLRTQAGRCAICDLAMRIPFVDHCHSTGKVRGLLCSQCNSGIGMFEDNPGLLEKAFVYLVENF